MVTTEKIILHITKFITLSLQQRNLAHIQEKNVDTS
jgi:hypothetical protein